MFSSLKDLKNFFPRVSYFKNSTQKEDFDQNLKFSYEKGKISKEIYEEFFKELLNFDSKKLIPIVRELNLTYLNYPKLLSIIKSIKEIQRKKVKGIFLEAGVALGGSLVLIAAYSKNQKIKGYDTFGLIPPPTKDDPQKSFERYKVIASGKSKGINGQIYYGYREDLISFVSSKIENLTKKNAFNRTELIKGKIQETMKINEKVAFAHIDVDWYESVKYCIENIWPKLNKGGILILDDYFFYEGCKKAVDKYFDKRNDYILYKLISEIQ